MNRLQTITQLFCLVAAASAAHAATILVTLDPNFPDDYHYYTYTATDSTTNSLPTGPYIGTFTGGSLGTIPADVRLFCLDINIDTLVGQPYSGFLIYPTTEADIESAYLENKVLQAGGYNADVQGVSGPVSMAIWTLENPSSVDPRPFKVDPATAALVTEAQNAYLNGTWTKLMAADFPMWIPDVRSSSQRFGVMLGPQFETTDIVPEPGSAILFGIAGLLLFSAWKLRLIASRKQVVVRRRS